MKAVILQSSYLPWKGYFDLIHDADVFIFYDDAKYTKNDWRNRNEIYSPNGIQWLTIPIPASAVHLKVHQVEIREHAWQGKHYKAIQLAYQRAPFFSQVQGLLQELFCNRTWHSLSELNQFGILEISKMLGIKTRFADSREFNLRGSRVEKLIHLLNLVGATEYLTGPKAKAYIRDEEPLFEKAGIQLHFKDYSSYPSYPQGRKIFAHEVSIIDMLVNLELKRIPQYIWEPETATASLTA